MPRDGTQTYVLPFPDVVSDTKIESPVYNGFTNDVAQDLNAPRPIIAGGTGATSAEEALENLGAEKASQIVTNYNSHVFLAGSFSSAPGATGSPVSGHAFAGIVYVADSNNLVVEARDLDLWSVVVSPGSNPPPRVYVRQKKDGVWNAWAAEDDLSGVNASIDAIEADVAALESGKAPVASPSFTGTISINGVPASFTNANYHQLYEPTGTAAILLGSLSGDAASYYRNTRHYFQSSSGGAVGYATLGPSVNTSHLGLYAPKAGIASNDTQVATTSWVREYGQPKDAQLFAGIPPMDAGSGNYTTVAADAQKMILFTGNLTINGGIYPVGTVLSFFANGGTISITNTETMYFNMGGSVLSGGRVLSNVGVATAVKHASGGWVISGNGLT